MQKLPGDAEVTRWTGPPASVLRRASSARSVHAYSKAGHVAAVFTTRSPRPRFLPVVSTTGSRSRPLTGHGHGLNAKNRSPPRTLALWPRRRRGANPTKKAPPVRSPTGLSSWPRRTSGSPRWTPNIDPAPDTDPDAPASVSVTREIGLTAWLGNSGSTNRSLRGRDLLPSCSLGDVLEALLAVGGGKARRALSGRRQRAGHGSGWAKGALTGAAGSDRSCMSARPAKIRHTDHEKSRRVAGHQSRHARCAGDDCRARAAAARARSSS
jgi:hypothetical protein